MHLLQVSWALAIAFGAATCNAQTQYTATASASVAAARATAKTLSPTSSVPGKTFDRFVNIFLENTDFDMAAADRTSPPCSKRSQEVSILTINSEFEVASKSRHYAHEL